MITLDPNYGSVLGGSPVTVTGEQLAITEEDEFECTFDAIQVRGVFVSENAVLCVTPMLERTGRTEFNLRVTRSRRHYFSAESTFTSCRYSLER